MITKCVNLISFLNLQAQKCFFPPNKILCALQTKLNADFSLPQRNVHCEFKMVAVSLIKFRLRKKMTCGADWQLAVPLDLVLNVRRFL